MKNLHVLRLLAFVLVTSWFWSSCGDGTPEPVEKGLRSYNHQAASSWNNLFLEVERYAAGYRPGPAPRALSLMGFAAYEACIPGMPSYNSLAPLYAGLSIPAAAANQEYHWPTVVNAVYGYMMPRFFADVNNNLRQRITTLESANEVRYQAETTPDIFARSKQRGIAVATAVWEWSKGDLYGHDSYKDPFGDYIWQDHFKKPGDWAPTFPGPGKGMGPYFGRVRTWALPESAKLARPPLAYSEDPKSALYAQAVEVYAQNTPTWSYEAEWIGEFWSDDLLDLTFSPGPRWTAIANQVIEAEKSDLETAVVTYAKVGMALNDAAVGCWHSKYFYNVERPQSYIQRVIDPSWKPGLDNPLTGEKGVTPSFPAYPSGHSTMGAAGAEALASMFGYSYAMTDNCHRDRAEFSGMPRSFGSFYEMALENAWSRVPLGVHYRMDCEEGVRHGTVIGRFVNNLPWKK